MAESQGIQFDGESKADFDKKLQEFPDKIVIVDFYATWCGPCKMIAPQLVKYLKEVNESGEKLVLLKVDVDESQDVAASLKISAMPTFHIYKNSEKKDEVVGANIEKVKAAVQKCL